MNDQKKKKPSYNRKRLAEMKAATQKALERARPKKPESVFDARRKLKASIENTFLSGGDASSLMQGEVWEDMPHFDKKGIREDLDRRLRRLRPGAVRAFMGEATPGAKLMYYRAMGR